MKSWFVCTVPQEHNRHNHDAVKQLAEKHRELKITTTPIKGMIDNLSKACKVAMQ